MLIAAIERTRIAAAQDRDIDRVARPVRQQVEHRDRPGFEPADDPVLAAKPHRPERLAHVERRAALDIQHTARARRSPSGCGRSR